MLIDSRKSAKKRGYIKYFNKNISKKPFNLFKKKKRKRDWSYDKKCKQVKIS